jgi:hypothetical protein
MTHRETDSGCCARAAGSVGCEILDPDGEVIAWTVDGWWAAAIVRLLERAEEGDLKQPQGSQDLSVWGSFVWKERS